MNSEEYKNQIIEMVKQMRDIKALRRIYLILVVILREEK